MADDSPEDNSPREPAAEDTTRALAEATERITVPSGLADAFDRMDDVAESSHRDDETPRGLSIGQLMAAVKPPTVTIPQFRDPKLEAANEANRRLAALARLLDQTREAQHLQAEEQAQREAERDARDQKTLEVTKRTYVVAVVALIVAVVAIVVSVIVA